MMLPQKGILQSHCQRPQAQHLYSSILTQEVFVWMLCWGFWQRVSKHV